MSRMTDRSTAAAAVLGAVLTLAGCAAGGTEGGVSAPQARVAEAGAQVMPFDLERTTHVFTDLPDGGLQTVTADDPGDTGQIVLIRRQLSEEADMFDALHRWFAAQSFDQARLAFGDVVGIGDPCGEDRPIVPGAWVVDRPGHLHRCFWVSPPPVGGSRSWRWCSAIHVLLAVSGQPRATSNRCGRRLHRSVRPRRDVSARRA
jgi:hypothetical protein